MSRPCGSADAIVMRPGPGWQYLGSSVWEHTSGTRISLLGVVRLPDMTFRYLTNLDEGREGWRFIAINGGNIKRGMMAWALNLAGA